MNNKRTVTFQFIDGTSMTIVFPEQGGDDSTTKMANIRKAMEAERVPVRGQIAVDPDAQREIRRNHPHPRGAANRYY